MPILARHYATGRPLAIDIVAGRIASVTDAIDLPTLPFISPSFFDPQINGCLGFGFVSPNLNEAAIRTIAETCARHGIGAFAPTLITSSFETLENGFRTLSKVLETDAELGLRMPVFHLEGPYISGDDGPRGAHPKAHTRDPDWDEFRRWQDAAGGRIRMVTVAPERHGTMAFIEKLAASGVVVAIGHTSATAAQIRNAVTAGATTSTHLGNGCHATLPRHENVIWEQLANDGLCASLITDGHHLPASVVKSFVRAKTVARIFITCDAGNLAGLPPGRYNDWGTELEVLPNGKIVVPGTPYLAGSGSFTDTCIGHMVRMAGVTLAEAIDMAAVRTRELLRLPVPTLAVGERSDFILFDWDGESLQMQALCTSSRTSGIVGMGNAKE